MTAARSAPEQVASGLSVWQVKYGERTVRRSEVFHDFARYGVPDRELAMDYSFWVLRAADAVILVDTGYDIAAHDWLGEILVTPTPVGLDAIGVDPEDVQLVIASHFHYDHIGYLGLFPRAEVVAARAEYDHWMAKKRAGVLEGEFATIADLEAVEAAEVEGRLRLVEAPEEVFPGVTVYPVGGHCPGQLIVLVRTSAAPVILTADAAHFTEQIEHEWPFFAYSDLGEMTAGLRFINRLAAEMGATVIPGHDATVRATFPSAPGPAATVATVIA